MIECPRPTDCWLSWWPAAPLIAYSFFRVARAVALWPSELVRTFKLKVSMHPLQGFLFDSVLYFFFDSSFHWPWSTNIFTKDSFAVLQNCIGCYPICQFFRIIIWIQRFRSHWKEIPTARSVCSWKFTIGDPQRFESHRLWLVDSSARQSEARICFLDHSWLGCTL